MIDTHGVVLEWQSVRTYVGPPVDRWPARGITARKGFIVEREILQISSLGACLSGVPCFRFLFAGRLIGSLFLLADRERP